MGARGQKQFITQKAARYATRTFNPKSGDINICTVGQDKQRQCNPTEGCTRFASVNWAHKSAEFTRELLPRTLNSGLSPMICDPVEIQTKCSAMFVNEL